MSLEVFRLLPVPNTMYKVRLTYQKTPTLFTSPAQLWGIPDNMETLYSNFMLWLMLDYLDDPRAARYRQLAESTLLARAEGLNETDRNMFLGNWLPLMAQEMNNRLSTGQGSQARAI
jgi:hypothetical protein